MDPNTINKKNYEGVEKEDSLLHGGEEPLLGSISDMSITNTFESKGVTVNNIREKSYQCNHCDKTYTKNSNLKRHMETHTGVKSHQCSQYSIEAVI